MGPARGRRARGRTLWKRPLHGTLDRLVVESELLARNPLGDPARRPLYVYRPPGVERDAPGQAVFAIGGAKGLEPLTFSLRRHGVDLIRREHGVIGVQVAAAGAPWLHRGSAHGAHG
jgi:hypothetical protein